jgi:hypothetical protein
VKDLRAEAGGSTLLVVIANKIDLVDNYTVDMGKYRAVWIE